MSIVKSRNGTELNKLNNVYDIKDYGAIGDGSADDTEAIQIALDTCETAGGGIVFIPEGIFKITYTLLYGSNVQIVGIGRGSVIYYDTNQVNGTAIVSKSYAEGVTTENCYISNFYLKTKTTHGNGIGVPRAKNIILENLYTDQIHWHLLDLVGGENILAENCKALGTDVKNAAFQIDNLTAVGGLYVELANHTLVPAYYAVPTYAKKVTLKKCIAEDTYSYGLHFHRNGGQDILIESCIFKKCGSYNIYQDVSVTDWKNIEIVNCILERDLSDSIGYNAQFNSPIENLQIYNNRIENGAYGIYVEDGSNVQINNNIFKHIATKAVYQETGSIIDVSNNSFENIAYGVNVEGLDYTGTKTDQSKAGIHFNGCNIVKADNNVFEDTRCTGILFSGVGDNISVCSNDFDGVANGISSPDSNFLSNVICNGNKIRGRYKSDGTSWLFWGEYLNKVKNISVANNKVYDTQRDGIAIDNFSELFLNENDVVNEGSQVQGYSGISVYIGDNLRLGDNKVFALEPTKQFIQSDLRIYDTDSVIGECLEITPAKLLIEDNNSGVVIQHRGSTAPSSGYYSKGSIVYNTIPTIENGVFWIATADGIGAFATWISSKLSKIISRGPDDGNPVDVGNWRVESLGIGGTAHYMFQIPSDFKSLIKASILIIPDNSETIDYDINGNHVLTGVNYIGSSFSSAGLTKAVTVDVLTEIDITSILTNAGVAKNENLVVKLTSNISVIRAGFLQFEYV